jgi:hypothetical protein
MTHDEAFGVLKARDWAAESNTWGTLWVVGPEVNGVLEVLGMAPSFVEAVEMAMRSVSAAQESKG